MDSDPLLLDTCAAIWLANNEQLAADALERIQQAVNGGESIAVSPISAWEVGLLSARGRLNLSRRPEAWFATLLSLPGMALAPLDIEVLIASSYLPELPTADPADRIIVATARERGLRLVTRDRKLLDYGAQGHVKIMAC